MKGRLANDEEDDDLERAPWEDGAAAVRFGTPSTQEETDIASTLRSTPCTRVLLLPGHAQVDVTTEPVEAVIKNSLSDNLGQRLTYIKVDRNAATVSTPASQAGTRAWLSAALATPGASHPVPTRLPPGPCMCCSTRHKARAPSRAGGMAHTVCSVPRTQDLPKPR